MSQFSSRDTPIARLGHQTLGLGRRIKYKTCVDGKVSHASLRLVDGQRVPPVTILCHRLTHKFLIRFSLGLQTPLAYFG
ncbi:MAG: hypothetical protein KME16_20755 [Scytolyngbya sp. HA4215-MV1]|nr:hypothetical protein [Scytolyngbya sp. HA4215-MV1]